VTYLKNGGTLVPIELGDTMLLGRGRLVSEDEVFQEAVRLVDDVTGETPPTGVAGIGGFDEYYNTRFHQETVNLVETGRARLEDIYGAIQRIAGGEGDFPAESHPGFVSVERLAAVKELALKSPDLSRPWQIVEKFGKTSPQVVNLFEDRWPIIIKDIEKSIAAGIVSEKVVENALASLRRGEKLAVGLNDEQVKKFFRPDIEEAARITSSRQAEAVSIKETVIPQTRERSGFATDPGRGSRYSGHPRSNQDAVGNYQKYIVYDVSPQDRVAAARSGKQLSSSMEIRPLHLNPEDLVTKGRVYVLSDGVGGDKMPGDIASNFIVENTLSTYYSPAFRPDLVDPAARMKAVLEEVNSKLIRATNSESDGTLNVIVVLDDKVWVFNVGDSKACRVDRNGKITLLTTDQNWGNEMVTRGNRTPEEVKNHPNARNLWSYMGGADEHFKIDIQQFTVRSGEKYIQISDGVLEVLTEEEIAGIVKKAETPQEAAQSIIEAANSKETFLDKKTSVIGRRDNISAQVIEIFGDKKAAFFE
jgi:protein phosphatase